MNPIFYIIGFLIGFSIPQILTYVAKKRYSDEENEDSTDE